MNAERALILDANSRPAATPSLGCNRHDVCFGGNQWANPQSVAESTGHN
jgi:hypothetical protein